MLTQVGASPLAVSACHMLCPTFFQKAACCAAGARRTKLPRCAYPADPPCIAHGEMRVASPPRLAKLRASAAPVHSLRCAANGPASGSARARVWAATVTKVNGVAAAVARVVGGVSQ